jgi:hypothetical protein
MESREIKLAVVAKQQNESALCSWGELAPMTTVRIAAATAVRAGGARFHWQWLIVPATGAVDVPVTR